MTAAASLLQPLFGPNFMGGSGASFVPNLSGGMAAPSSAFASGSTVGGINDGNWTVATGSASATSTPSSGIPWTTIAIVAVVGILAWKLAR